MRNGLKSPDWKWVQTLLKVLAAIIAAVLGILGGQSMIQQGRF